jgi:magnesium transporter
VTVAAGSEVARFEGSLNASRCRLPRQRRTERARMARTRMYRNGKLDAENFELADVSKKLKLKDALVWVDLCAPDAAELQLVADELGIHKLAVEGALNEHQRPKVDRYASHSFLNAYSVILDDKIGELVTGEVAAFILPNALVTVRKNDRFDLDGVVERWDNEPDLLISGVGAMVHGLLDFLVDGHFEAVQSLDEQIEALEDLLFGNRAQDEQVQHRSFTLRKSLVLLRRVVLPMREVVNTLMREDLNIVDGELMPYYQDVYDHVLRATEWTESLRDLVTSVLETNLTIQGNRLNIITKKVTSWAAIIAVPTAITGFYGQNIPYPGFSHESGFLTSCAVIVVLSATLYAVFRRKGWL